MQDAKKEELNNKDLELGVEINNDLRLNNHDLIKKSGSLGSSPSAPFDPPLVVGMHGLHWDLVVVICIRGLFLLLKCQVWSATQTCVWFSVSVFSKKKKGEKKRERLDERIGQCVSWSPSNPIQSRAFRQQAAV